MTSIRLPYGSLAPASASCPLLILDCTFCVWCLSCRLPFCPFLSMSPLLCVVFMSPGSWSFPSFLFRLGLYMWSAGYCFVGSPPVFLFFFVTALASRTWRALSPFRCFFGAHLLALSSTLAPLFHNRCCSLTRAARLPSCHFGVAASVSAHGPIAPRDCTGYM